MKGRLRNWLAPALVSLCISAQGQGGIRAIIWNGEPILAGTNPDMLHYGLGFDHDLNDRQSMNVSARISRTGWVVSYMSAFHFSDNQSSSFYMGPTLGLRQITTGDGATRIPVGLRVGVRGGLERFYADLYAGYRVDVIGKDVVIGENAMPMDIRRSSFMVGLDLGWGWARRRSRY